MTAVSSLDQSGHGLLKTDLEEALLNELRSSAFSEGEAGTRCLLDLPSVRTAAQKLKAFLIAENVLSPNAVAIQAIAFDKTPDANWKVTWHKDVMFPFARPVTDLDYTLPCTKDGNHYARPPQSVLETMLAVRVHLDDCDETNGPLRVAPHSHRSGVFKSTEIASALNQYPEITCLAKQGEAILMRPLLLHASSRALVAKHRRVLHVVFHSGEAISEEWHGQI